MTEIEQIANELQRCFGFIVLAHTGFGYSVGQVIDGPEGYKVVVVGISSLEEYNQQRQFCGSKPFPDDWKHALFYRVKAE